MELILPFILEYPNFWEYIYPLNILCGMFLLLGFGLQILFFKRRIKWFLLPLILLVLSVSCEFLYQIDGTFDAFLFVFIGVPVYFALLGSLIYNLLYQFWTKVRNSKKQIP